MICESGRTRGSALESELSWGSGSAIVALVERVAETGGLPIEDGVPARLDSGTGLAIPETEFAAVASAVCDNDSACGEGATWPAQSPLNTLLGKESERGPSPSSTPELDARHIALRLSMKVAPVDVALLDKAANPVGLESR